MSVLLELPAMPTSYEPRFVDFGGNLTPALGGPVQRLNRLGDRHGLAVSMPPLSEADGRILISRLRRGKREGVILPWPQPHFVIGNPGAPVVNGAGQQGMALALRGMTPGYAVREGQAFSVIHGGRYYVHTVAAPAIASGIGTVSLSIFPMLRISPLDGATCTFTPMIEGLLQGNELRWTLSRARLYGIDFEVVEAE